MRRICVLDGGMGHELKSRGVHLGMETGLEQLAGCFLPGALACRDCPETVRTLHSEYIAAGATVITTNNFVATPHYLGKTGRADDMEELIKAAAVCAREAADAAGKEVLVAGCLPPLKESYQVEGLGSEENMRAVYTKMASILAPLVDIILCETLASRAEVRAAASAASTYGKPVWVAMTLQDDLSGRLRSGESLTDAVRDIDASPQLGALLLNCCAPQSVTSGLEHLRDVCPPGVRMGGYANGFQTTTSEWLSGKEEAAFHTTSEKDFEDGVITPSAYARHTAEWVSKGAEIVGGCCGVGPRHIQQVARKCERVKD